MASSDDEDIEALRLAALATLKPKEEQEPQGIQVLRSVSGTSINQYHQAAAAPPHNAAEMGYADYGEVPYDFQQAVLQKQAQGQGFHQGYPPRGRGWGRGRGRGFGNYQNYNFPPKQQQSALIVIQVAGNEPPVQPQPNYEVKTKTARPFLLRPQDKWASGNSPVSSTSPHKSKDTSKFSRYTDNSDSDEDDDDDRSSRKSAQAHHEGDGDIADDAQVDAEADLDYISDNHIEVHNSQDEEPTDECMDGLESETAKHDNKLNESTLDDSTALVDTSLADISDINLSATFDETVSKSEDERKIVVTSVRDFAIHKQKAEVMETDVPDSSVLDESLATVTSVGEAKPVQDDNISPGVADNALTDDLKQDDSVSNSYSTFSRFNRRTRQDSDSGEEDSDVDSIASAKKSTKSLDDSLSPDSEALLASDSEPELDIGDKSESDNEILKIESNGAKNKPKVSRSSENSKQSITSSKSRSSYSSSSDSDSSVSSRQPSPKSTSKGLSKFLHKQDKQKGREPSRSKSRSPVSKTTLKTTAKKPKKRSVSPLRKEVWVEKRSRESAKLGEVKPSHSNKHSAADKDKHRTRSTSNERSRDGYRSKKFDNDKKQSAISNKAAVKRSHEGKARTQDVASDVKADPEFDAANYRDDSVYHRNSKHSKIGKAGNDEKQRDKYKDVKVVKEHTKQRGGNKSKESDSQYSEVRHKESDSQYSEVRHFKEIGKLKDQVRRDDSRSAEASGRKAKTLPDKYQPSRSERKENNVGPHSISPGPSRKHKEINKDTQKVNSGKKKSNTESKHAADISNDKQRKNSIRSSTEKLHRQVSGKRKSTDKAEKEIKRKSIEDKLRDLVDMGAASDSSEDSSDSSKQVSSLSDSSTNSESETWRNKKQGGSRKHTDIELERRRRQLQERERRREQERNSRNSDKVGKDGQHGGRSRLNKSDRDRDGGRTDRARAGDRNTSNRDDSSHDRFNARQRDTDFRNKAADGMDSREKYYHKKQMVFYDEKPVYSNMKKFEEITSESDSDSKTTSLSRGVVSVIKSERDTTRSTGLLDLKVSKSVKDSAEKKLSKKERLVIQVQQSSEDEGKKSKSEKKKHKLKKKKKQHREISSSDDDDEVLSNKGDNHKHMKQVVNVVFDEKEKSRQSVRDRLGDVVRSKLLEGKADTGVKRSHKGDEDRSGKRIKTLNASSKHSGSGKHKHAKTQDAGDGTEALDRRIQKIKEKNATILRRKQEVEQDKQKYG